MRVGLAALAVLGASVGAWGQVPDAVPDAPTPKARVLLTASDAALAFTDTAYTQAHIYAPGAYERDPIAKPLVRHPALAYGAAALETGGLWWLGGRMRRSDRWHRVWWVPQAVAIGLHAGALGQSVHSWKR